MNNWLTSELKQNIKRVFEPRYCRKLTNDEVLEIAENLSAVVEEICKFRWREKYEKQQIKP